MPSLLTLSNGESYFRTLFDACGEAFIVTNEQGQSIDCNHATLDLFCCQREDILGTTPLDWSPELQPDGKRSDQSAAEIFARAAVGETVCFEWENLRLDRRPVFVSVTVRRADIDGHACYMVISRNISDRKQAEDALREERILRETIQNAIPGVAYALDANGFFRFWSLSLEIVTGRTGDEIKRINALDLFEGDDRVHISERIKAVFSQGESVAEAELVAKDGRRTPYYFTGKRIELNGESILVGAGMDITARVQAERALHEEQDRFRTLFESSPDPVWIIENNKFIECNEAAVKILGFSSRSKLLFVHPSELSPEFQPDGESSFAKAERMMESARRNGINRFEWTHTRANGENFPAEVTLSSIILQGRPVIYCVWRDITERKQAEEALLQSDITFRKLFEESADAILLIDKSRVFVECNQAALNILKMRREDFLHRSLIRISPEFQPNGRRSDEAEQDMMDQAYAKGLHRFDWTCVNAEGCEFIVEVSLMPITVKGQVMLHTTWRDITERKEVERKLERLARTDDLTGLTNRRHFLEQAEAELARSIRYDRPISILMVDADLFKGINDLHGHAVGDTTLRKLADVFRETLRAVDLVGRLGGEEFAILLPETDHDMAIEVAERLRTAVADSKVPLTRGLPLQFTVSIGVSSLISKHDNLEVLISLADTALYAAKNSGRNKVCSSLAAAASVHQ